MTAIDLATPEPVLSVEHIAVHFGGLVAIADMSFTVNKGEVVSLIGPNGAGKTTAFNVITGFLRPTKGEVRYRGNSLSNLKPHQVTSLGLARTFQRTSVFQSVTVFDNVMIGLHRRGRSSLLDVLLALPREKQSEAELRHLAQELLEMVGIARRADELAGSLSYGDQRLLGVALALASDPSMLLLDEPVSGMNATETARFMELLDKLHKRGMSILLVEHDVPMVMGVSDRIVVLNYGRIIASGPPAEIRGNPEVIRAYLGEKASRHAAH
ncbi:MULTISPECIES: ABC transporter ATP-binding protein [Bradyrhizobium]|jgi:branched-chain amino acid transport system ATP-binding protein|uniref:ABC transporter ATP-binding protein n=1 Tax=Bradyrhizobium TaxID=374 RepID=UPI000400BE2F